MGAARKYGLTRLQWKVLDHIHEKRGENARVLHASIVRHLREDAVLVAEALLQLEEDGLVRMDRPEECWNLTPWGEQVRTAR